MQKCPVRRKVIVKLKNPLRVSYEDGMFMISDDVRRFVEGEELVEEDVVEEEVSDA